MQLNKMLCKATRHQIMTKEYHILNGDSLKEQLPEQITGEIIVMRECFVDGDVQSRDLEDLYEIRTNFINSNYSECSKNDYYKKVISEIQKMQKIPKGSQVNLWFEDDLFCQVNLWFVINLLNNNGTDYFLHLVRPTAGHEYSFGGMDRADFVTACRNRTEISLPDIQKFSKLWKFYQVNDYDKMLQIAGKLKKIYPFLIPAVEAHIARMPLNGSPGRPEKSIISIMNELQTNDFPLVFREFCKRERIYGFGDVQVKRLFEKIVKNSP